MKNYINCIAHKTSEGNLLIGEEKTAMIDCGMMFCRGSAIEMAKKNLGGKPLDYIFATHTHYDHIGALPAFRAEFPGVRLVTSEVGAAVLLKDTPRRVIRELSDTAAKEFRSDYDFNAEESFRAGQKFQDDYTDDVFCADVIVKEGDTISLGGFTAEVLETPGHTRDSLSFYIQEPELLILSETTGVLMTNGVVCPCYLTSYTGAVEAIKKCRRYPYQYLSLPHRGIVNADEADRFFDKALSAAEECNDFIINLYKSGHTDDEIFDSFYRKFYTEAVSAIQPKAAFALNAHATVACSIREYNESLRVQNEIKAK